MKTITLLGSTGSVGTQAIDVIRREGFSLYGICANRNVMALEAQIREFSPKVCVALDENAAADLRIRVADTQTKVLCGAEAIEEMASADAPDMVLNSMMGSAGLRPTLCAIRAGKDIALANKETLVTAGKIVMGEAKKHGVSILPVDSEHSAIFQCLQGNTQNPISHILLTASGGPFFGRSRRELAHIGVKETLAHPTWKMGAKITVDSATMMNKGFEVIEAAHLFSVKPEQIEVLVHKQSIVHSMVEYCDGVVMAQMGVPDMRTCIQYALTYPNRSAAPLTERLNLAKAATLTFCEPDRENFPLLDAAYEALSRGGIYGAALNGANEQAVSLFLQEQISFLQIAELVQEVLRNQTPIENPTLEELIEADRQARLAVCALCQK